MVGGQSSYLPLKINMAGVIPPIFASSIILFPATLGGWFSQSEGMGWLADITASISPGQPLYVMFYGLAIVFFTFFYTALTFDSKDTQTTYVSQVVLFRVFVLVSIRLIILIRLCLD